MEKAELKYDDADQSSRSNQSRALIVRNSGFKLESLNRYTGTAKIRRLIFIAETCPELKQQAYLEAVAEYTRVTLNTEDYVTLVTEAKEKLGEMPELELDGDWLRAANRKFTEQMAKLEADLNTYTREARIQQLTNTLEKMAELYMQRGDYTAALGKYLEVKDQSPAAADKLRALVNAVTASALSKNPNHVKTQGDRALAMGPELIKHPLWRSQIYSALGLWELRRGSFLNAADAFLNVGVELLNQYNQVITAADVAVYGTLCALASYSRRTFKARVLDSESFRKMIDLVPEMGKLVNSFYNCAYGTLYETLNANEMTFALDQYLNPHVRKLLRQIKDKAVIQYFSSFDAVKIPKMAKSFNMEVSAMERELVQLIGEKKIFARIDSQNKVLYARKADQRVVVFENAIAMTDTYLREAKSLLLRMSLANHKFVCAAPRDPSQLLRASGMSDVSHHMA